MGADIHLFVEKKINDKWVMLYNYDMDHSTPTSLRNYDRFAALAGVRGEGPEPRGLPEDVSSAVWYFYQDWGTDTHSASWLPLSEAARIWLETDYDPDSFAKKWPEYHYFNVEGDDIRDYRVVFWFDN